MSVFFVAWYLKNWLSPETVLLSWDEFCSVLSQVNHLGVRVEEGLERSYKRLLYKFAVPG